MFPEVRGTDSTQARAEGAGVPGSLPTSDRPGTLISDLRREPVASGAHSSGRAQASITATPGQVIKTLLLQLLSDKRDHGRGPVPPVHAGGALGVQDMGPSGGPHTARTLSCRRAGHGHGRPPAWKNRLSQCLHCTFASLGSVPAAARARPRSPSPPPRSGAPRAGDAPGPAAVPCRARRARNASAAGRS